jgi:hypothetical protein
MCTVRTVWAAGDAEQHLCLREHLLPAAFIFRGAPEAVDAAMGW